MSIKYEYSESLQVLAEDIARRLFPHIQTGRIKCYRSNGDTSSIIARCHSLGKLMQQALNSDPFYVFEFNRDLFDDLPTEEKVKVVIEKMLNIPLNFKGGFANKDKVTQENIKIAYEKYLECRKNNSKVDILKDFG